MKISDKKAKQILDFLAKRLGFIYARITRFKDCSFLEFGIKNDCSWVALGNELDVLEEFKPDATFADCLLKCLENRKTCGIDVPVYDSNGNYDSIDWMPIFKDSDTLETLAIEADLER